MASDTANALESVRALRSGGYSPKQIARALHLRPAVVAPLVRKLAAEEAAAAPEPALFGCWVSPGWSRNLSIDGHRDWPDRPVPEDGPGGIGCVAVARRHRPHRVSVCGYLVDTYCLGVKNALGPEVMNERALPGFLRDYFAPFEEVGGSLAVPVELARHLVWGAVDHARSLGFEPAPDFTAAAGHLGGWAATSAITFGRDATPVTVRIDLARVPQSASPHQVLHGKIDVDHADVLAAVPLPLPDRRRLLADAPPDGRARLASATSSRSASACRRSPFGRAQLRAGVWG
jgi:hypothetical protein